MLDASSLSAANSGRGSWCCPAKRLSHESMPPLIVVGCRCRGWRRKQRAPVRRLYNDAASAFRRNHRILADDSGNQQEVNPCIRRTAPVLAIWARHPPATKSAPPRWSEDNSTGPAAGWRCSVSV